MKPNFRLCDACKKKMPEGMEIITGYKRDDAPDHFDNHKGELVPTELRKGKSEWEFCHSCLVSLVKGIIDGADPKQEMNIHIRCLNIRANGG